MVAVFIQVRLLLLPTALSGVIRKELIQTRFMSILVHHILHIALSKVVSQVQVTLTYHQITSEILQNQVILCSHLLQKVLDMNILAATGHC